MSFLSVITYSVFAPLKSLRLITKNSKLMKLSIIPLLIGILTYSLLVFLVWHFFPSIAEKIAGSPDGFFEEIWYYIKNALMILVAGFAIIFSFSLFVNIVASPFNERLAREILLTKGVDIPQDPKFLKEIGRIIAVETRKSLFLLLIAGLAFVIGLIPIFSPIAFFVTASLLSFAYIDFSLEVMRLPFKTRIKFYTKNIIPIGIMGMIYGITLSIPVLNLFMIPILTGSGALFYYKVERNKQK